MACKLERGKAKRKTPCLAKENVREENYSSHLMKLLLLPTPARVCEKRLSKHGKTA